MNAIANDRLDEIGGGINPHVMPVPTPVIEPGFDTGKVPHIGLPPVCELPIDIQPVITRF